MITQPQALPLLLLLAAFGCAGELPKSLDIQQATSPEKGDPRMLSIDDVMSLSQADQALEREISDGERHVYRLVAPPESYVQISVNQLGIDLYLELLKGDDVLVDADSPTGSWGIERLRAIAPEDESLELIVGAVEGQTPGSYLLQVEALRLASDEDRVRVEAFREFGEGEAERREKTYEAATQHYQKALELWNSVGETVEVAQSHYRLGWMAREMNETAQAVTHYQEALTRLTGGGDPRIRITLLNRLGNALLDLGRHGEAEEAFERSMAEIEAAPGLASQDRATLEAVALVGLGNVHLYREHPQKALNAYSRCLAIVQRSQQVLEAEAKATLHHNLGDLYLSQGDLASALDHFRSAFDLSEGSPFAPRALARMAAVLTRQQQWTEARPLFERALDQLRTGDDRREIAGLLAELGLLHLETGNLDDAEESLTSALAHYRELDDAGGQAMAFLRLGRTQSARGDFSAALALHRQAWPLFEQAEDHQGSVSARYNEALMLCRLGLLEEARDVLEPLVEDAEDLRARSHIPRLRAAYMDTRRHYWELLVDVLMRLHEKDSAPLFDQVALQESERARSRSLLDLVSDVAVSTTEPEQAAFLDRQRELEDSINAVHRQKLLLQTWEPDNDEGPVLLDERLRALSRELDHVRSQLRIPQGGPPALAQISEIQEQVLDSETRLAVYFLGENRSFLWWVGRDSIQSFVLPQRQKIEEAARTWLGFLPGNDSRSRDQRQKRGDDLSTMLLGPLAGSLDGKRLVVVADGVLRRIPFSALPIPNQDAGPATEQTKILLDRYEVVYAPSLSILRALRQRQPLREPVTGVMIVGDPVYTLDDKRIETAPTGSRPAVPQAHPLRSIGLDDLTRLPGSGVEAREIRELAGRAGLSTTLLTDFAATRETLLGQDLTSFGVLHFATHALVDEEIPNLSSLVLSLYDQGGAARDGFLRLHEISRLPLNAELVVLSACRTGLGQEVVGEGFVGLAYGFLSRGTPRLLNSLWSVEDGATTELMRRFYRNLFKHAMAPAAALAAAQRSMRAETEWREPSDWAGFVFQGDWRPLDLQAAAGKTVPDIPIERLDAGGTEPTQKPPDDPTPIYVPSQPGEPEEEAEEEGLGR